MKLPKLTVLALSVILFTACGGKEEKNNAGNQSEPQSMVEETTTNDAASQEAEATETTETIDVNAPTLDNKGIGPVTNVELSDEIDQALADKGKELYKANCTACHKFKKRYIGPALAGITERRSPEWIMNMMLNTTEMLEKDPVAKALIQEYNAPMAQQTLTEEDARAIVEYFRTKTTENQ